MKKIISLAGLVLASSSFAQSYLILNNGIVLTTDKAGFAYDVGQFIAPYKVSMNGGQFLAAEEKLVSVDEKGFLYHKEEKAPKKLKGKGLNYLVADNGAMYSFDANGFLYKFDKDSSLKKATNFGGNFLTVTDDKKVDLYTVTAKGNYFKMNVQGLNPAEITVFGGNFFMTNKGVVYTVSTEGYVFSKADMKVNGIKKMGGNYFIDQNDLLYTVTDEGFLMVPAVPESLKVASVMKLGANYFLDRDGKMFVVSSAGIVMERTLDHDLRQAKIFSSAK